MCIFLLEYSSKLTLPRPQFTVKLHAESFHGYRCDPPSLDVSVTKDQMVDLYTQMVRSICLKIAVDVV